MTPYIDIKIVDKDGQLGGQGAGGGGSLSTINGSCPNNPRATKGNAYLHEAYIFKSIQQIMLIWFVELLCERCFAEVEGNPISRKIPD